jgi:hypothetical protein
MHFLKVAALALFPLVLCAPSPRQSTSGTIILPADGTVIAPGQEFPFNYDGMADFGISSYNVCGLQFFHPCTIIQTSFTVHRLAADLHAHGVFPLN